MGQLPEVPDWREAFGSSGDDAGSLRRSPKKGTVVFTAFHPYQLMCPTHGDDRGVMGGFPRTPVAGGGYDQLFIMLGNIIKQKDFTTMTVF